MIIPATLGMVPGGVLVASASAALRQQVRNSFHDYSWPVQEALGGADALLQLETGHWHALYLDRHLPDLDAQELIETIKRRFPGIAVVLVESDPGKPWPEFHAGGKRETERPSEALMEAAEGEQPTAAQAEPRAEALPGMIGRAASMQRLYRLARLVAPRSTTVLITGATGTGKELVARALHQLSPRAGRPFLVVNCAAIPEALLESELFGHTRGAFTGAVQAHAGRILAAQHGTLFLDEVGELGLSLQGKLLRFLDQKEVQRLGSTEVVQVDVRVVAATNANLMQRVYEGRFRDDLYYRLSAFPLEVPRLAERMADIEALSLHFLRLATAPHPAPQLSREALRVLQSHPWGGNVRELQQVLERASILAQGDPQIEVEHFLFSSDRAPAGGSGKSSPSPGWAASAASATPQ